MKFIKASTVLLFLGQSSYPRTVAAFTLPATVPDSSPPLFQKTGAMRHLYSSPIDDDNDSSNEMQMQMPDASRLISEIPESERGIGVGIDLGTTNSAVSILTNEGNPRLIKVDGKNTIPSIVSIVKNRNGNSGSNGNEGDADVEIHVAKEDLSELYEYEYGDDQDDDSTKNNSHGFTYRHVKRVIGMGTTTAAGSAEVVPHLVIRTASQRRKGRSLNKKSKKEGLAGIGLAKILKDSKENPVRLALPDGVDAKMLGMDVNENNGEETEMEQECRGTIAPEFISGQILKKLFHAARAETGEQITRAVIGVPAYFNDMQREATIDAATLASSIPRERIRLLREPEAAALAYGIGKQQIGKGEEEELVLVFDLGGGTFDVSILEVGGGIYEVVATGGNNMLGGSDFDAKIAQHFSKKMVEHGCAKNYWKDAGDVAERLVTSAEQVRIALSNTREVVLGLPTTEEGWLQMQDARDVILSTRQYDEEYEDLPDAGMSDGSRAIVKFTRKAMEQMCLDEFLALLRPVREVAIMAGAMLPGDASPSAVEAVLQMEEELEMELAQNADTFADFYNESGEAEEQKHDDVSEEMLLQLKEFDMKEQKRKQQKGRKRARNTQKEERKYREQKRKADEDAKRRSNTQNVKVRDGINGRRITQVVLVGGATRMPAIGRLLAATTGVVPQKTVNPDECVALGCAVQVGILDGINTDLQVLSPIEAAMMRALAKKRGLDVEGNDDDFDDFDDFDMEGGLSETVYY